MKVSFLIFPNIFFVPLQLIFAIVDSFSALLGLQYDIQCLNTLLLVLQLVEITFRHHLFLFLSLKYSSSFSFFYLTR